MKQIAVIEVANLLLEALYKGLKLLPDKTSSLAEVEEVLKGLPYRTFRAHALLKEIIEGLIKIITSVIEEQNPLSYYLVSKFGPITEETNKAYLLIFRVSASGKVDYLTPDHIISSLRKKRSYTFWKKPSMNDDFFPLELKERFYQYQLYKNNKYVVSLSGLPELSLLPRALPLEQCVVETGDYKDLVYLIAGYNLKQAVQFYSDTDLLPLVEPYFSKTVGPYRRRVLLSLIAEEHWDQMRQAPELTEYLSQKYNPYEFLLRDISYDLGLQLRAHYEELYSSLEEIMDRFPELLVLDENEENLDDYLDQSNDLAIALLGLFFHKKGLEGLDGAFYENASEFYRMNLPSLKRYRDERNSGD